MKWLKPTLKRRQVSEQLCRKRFIKLIRAIGFSESLINSLVSYVESQSGKVSYDMFYTNLRRNLADIGLKHSQYLDSDCLGELLSRNGKLNTLNNNLASLRTMINTYDFNFSEFKAPETVDLLKPIDLNDKDLQKSLEYFQDKIFGALGLPRSLLLNDCE